MPKKWRDFPKVFGASATNVPHERIETGGERLELRGAGGATGGDGSQRRSRRSTRRDLESKGASSGGGEGAFRCRVPKNEPLPVSPGNGPPSLSGSASTLAGTRSTRVAETRIPNGLTLPQHGVGPNPTFVELIHRGPDGVIPLAVKDGGQQWRELGAIPVGQPFLPGLLQQLAHDGYFGLNSSFMPAGGYRKGYRTTVWRLIEGERGYGPDNKPRAPEEQVTEQRTRRQHVNPATGLQWTRHTSETLRWLNVAHCDLDFYKVGRDLGDTIGELVRMQQQRLLPPASVYVQSGRGLWALWLLLDTQNPTSGEAILHKARHRPDTPVRATARAMALYARVQRAITEKLLHLGADIGAADGPRYAPFPGTHKTRSDSRVLYWEQHLEDGNLPFYTLPGLATALGLELYPANSASALVSAALSVRPFEEPAPAVRRIIARHPASTSSRSGSGAKGWRQRWLYHVQDIEILLRLRGGTLKTWHLPSRNKALTLFVAVYTRAGEHAETVRARAEQLGATMGLQRTEIRAAIRNGRKRKGVKALSRRTLRAALAVTAVEASYLRADPARGPGREAAELSAAQRRLAVQGIIDANGGVPPSVRDTMRQLHGQGISVSVGTVHADYRRLGFQASSKPGRPPKLPL